MLYARKDCELEPFSNEQPWSKERYYRNLNLDTWFRHLRGSLGVTLSLNRDLSSEEKIRHLVNLLHDFQANNSPRWRCSMAGRVTSAKSVLTTHKNFKNLPNAPKSLLELNLNFSLWNSAHSKRFCGTSN